MNRLETLYMITKQMAEELAKLEDPETERDLLIDRVNHLIDQRDKLMADIKKPYTNEEIEFGQKVVKLNEFIKGRMKSLYEDIKSDMKQVQKKKEQNYSYIKPYGEIKTTDGLYIDNKL